MVDLVIGLEIHVQLNTLNTKLFCSCSTKYHALPPNSNTCPVCLGLPGSLPVLNGKAIRYAVMTALALNCKINRQFNFVRKNYFYPDMTKNFQISQYERAGGRPIAYDGFITIGDASNRVRIRRIQIEEDPGRLEHPTGLGTSSYVLVDYNRSGMGLLEIVTEPDLSSPKEARELVMKMRSILEHLGVCDTGKEGAMRADANISIAGGNRVEIKNITSYREIERALEYEASRQIEIVKAGGSVDRETRHWSEQKAITISSRSKEEEQDYRYFPEPDIPSFMIPETLLEDIKHLMPELPDARVSRFVTEYGLSKYDANVLVMEKVLADFFEDVAKLSGKPRLAASWISVELQRLLNEKKARLEQLRITSAHLARLLTLIDSGSLTGKLAKRVLANMVETGKDPDTISQELGLVRIADEHVLDSVVNEVFTENPQAVEDARSNPEALNFLIGQVMKKTKGKADPAITNLLVRKRLSDPSSLHHG